MTTKQQDRRVVLITGATGGIGKASAIAFAKEGGYDLALHYNTASESTRNDLHTAILDASSSDKSSGISVMFFQADMASYSRVRDLHCAVVNGVGEVDILFNNAGANCGQSGVQSLLDVSVETHEQTWRINTGSAILLTQLCLPHMEAKQWGRVIFCSSVAAFTGGVVGPHYASSKSAMHGFVHWLAGNVVSVLAFML